jgi:hypothetical protein
MTGARRAVFGVCAAQGAGRQGGGAAGEQGQCVRRWLGVLVLLRAPCDAQAQGRRGRRAAGSSRKGGGRRLRLESRRKGRRPSEEIESPSVTCSDWWWTGGVLGFYDLGWPGLPRNL